MPRTNPAPTWMKSLAALAVVFGLITLAKAGAVLFGSQSQRDAVGDFVPFVLQFNFVAGFFYVLAGVGIFLGRRWALFLSTLIALATIITTIFFARHVMIGGAYETQTVGALALRVGFWGAVTLMLWRKKAG